MLRLVIAVSAATVFAAGCEAPDPPDLSGTWQSVTGEQDAVTLDLKRDGTFIRTSLVGEHRFKTIGMWRVEGSQMVFDNVMEGLVGFEPKQLDVKGVIKEPFEITPQKLVFHPRSKQQREFVLLPSPVPPRSDERWVNPPKPQPESQSSK